MRLRRKKKPYGPIEFTYPGCGVVVVWAVTKRSDRHPDALWIKLAEHKEYGA